MPLTHTDISSTAVANVAHSKLFSISFCDICGLSSNLNSVHQHLQSSNRHALFVAETTSPLNLVQCYQSLPISYLYTRAFLHSSNQILLVGFFVCWLLWCLQAQNTLIFKTLCNGLRAHLLYRSKNFNKLSLLFLLQFFQSFYAFLLHRSKFKRCGFSCSVISFDPLRDFDF